MPRNELVRNCDISGLKGLFNFPKGGQYVFFRFIALTSSLKKAAEQFQVLNSDEQPLRLDKCIISISRERILAKTIRSSRMNISSVGMLIRFERV